MLWKYIMLESNPSDARLKIDKDQVCQTLKERMGTGGNNVPLVLGIRNETDSDYERSGRYGNAYREDGRFSDTESAGPWTPADSDV